MEYTMTQDNRQNHIQSPVISRDADLTLETVILLVIGVFMLLYGLLQFWIHTGVLLYTPDGTYGILLVIISLQIITMGKTPFGTFRRSWMLVFIGMSMAIIGTIACFIPGLLTELVRELVGIGLFSGGITLFLQLVILKSKARLWIRIPGILQQLTIACAFVYLTEVILGLVTLFPGITTITQTAVLYIICGLSFFYLAWCIQKASRLYPRQGTPDPAMGSSDTNNDNIKGNLFFFRDASISTPVTIILLLGVIFILFAILLVPVSMGIFLLSTDSQYGLLMVIMAIQIMALGKTPVGAYKRSWLLILIGLVIVSIGIFSCIVPGLRAGWRLILFGTWNIFAGSVSLSKIVLPILSGIRNPSAEPVFLSPVFKKLLVTAALLHLATIMFGINLLIPGLIPGLVVLATLFFLGFLFIVLAYLLANLPASE
jgi:hypothetical protein